MPRKAKVETWGYTLINSTIDNLIRHFEGQDATRAYSDFREKKERAHELIFECVGKKPVLFYLRRQGAGKDQGEEILDLTLATDNSQFPLPKRLQELKKTLGMKAAIKKNGNGGLKILSVYLLPPARGNDDAYSLPFCLQLIPNSYEVINIPPKQIVDIMRMPICGNHIPTDEQLQAWKAFLKVEERIAKSRQFCVRFVNLRYYPHKKEATVKINLESATLDGDSHHDLQVNDFWLRVKNAKNQDIKFSDSIPTDKNRYTSRQLGSINKIDLKNLLINIKIDRDLIEYINNGNYQLPNQGYLFFDALGDIKQIERKEKALEQLKQGRTQNPYLGDFLFDASQARAVKKTITLPPQDLLLSAANPGQKAAVEKVLSAEDLVLIQGPPGTGKTTVIAEICYQIALRGGRTLITSQANLAVDNALSRLVHNPVIRAIRKGKAERVGEEGQAFLEDQVINNWLDKTANYCENNLIQRQNNITIINDLLQLNQRFTDYLLSETEFHKQQEKLKVEQEQLESLSATASIQYQELLNQQKTISELSKELKKILKKPENIDWDDTKIKAFLPLLQPYTQGNKVVEEFHENVCVVVKYVDELGFIRPERGVFGLTVWLQEIVVTTITELKAVFKDVDNAVLEIEKLVTLVETFKADSQYLQKLQSEYQKNVNQEQNLLPNIKIWENRKREIDYIIEAVKEWKITADQHLYQVIRECQQNNLPLTENALDLPLGLLMFANNLNLTIVPKNYDLTIPAWETIKKSIVYEIDGKFSDRQGKKHHFSYFLQQTLSQIPLVLEKSDRTKWQEFDQQFANYQLLTSKQRQALVETTQDFMINLQVKYGKAFDFQNTHSTIERICQDLKTTILDNARKCVGKLKAEAEQQLSILNIQQQQLNTEPNHEVNEEQILLIQTQVEKASQNANAQLEKVINILESIHKQPDNLPKLHQLIQEYLDKPSKIWDNHPEFSHKIKHWQNCIHQIDHLTSTLNAVAVLENIQTILKQESSVIKKSTTKLVKNIESYQNQLQTILQSFKSQLPEQLIIERSWWNETWQKIPVHLQIANPHNDIFDLEFLHKIKTQFSTWEQQLQSSHIYLQKYQNFIQDWITKIRQPSERDSHDLRQIYLDHANVVGITCVQAANYNFSEEFKYFDVVIIDEVSKCTPPELLIPALKAKKLVMVGDHQQLPPMLDTNTVAEVAKNLGNTRGEIKFLEASLFKSQFETADPSIKQMLTIQYRMHPNIMGAINQFYHNKLECGLLKPDYQRAHNLADQIIQPKHHLLWIKTPPEEKFTEQKQGTSFFNISEIEIITQICQNLENTWSHKILQGEPKKEIAVITFYGAQLQKIDERLQPDIFPSLQIRTGTVDRFQGMERPIVIVSMVRNNSQGDVGFANKPERVNVAFSRAQELLVIVGCHQLFTSKSGMVGKMYSQVAKVVHEHGGFIDVSCFY
ncbi:MAG: AAA family ATPase [Sphaerospermopsis sp. SIO1G2]|nr:AAA family ATPase [Sphaerospermopsis sp. SIO1G2]